ncbi:MAG: hypothetical protein ACXVJG_12605, partial [Mucilaginibacter sp.]
LSFFAFSGFVSQTQFKHDKPQTTLVVTAKAKLIKSIGFKRALAQTEDAYHMVPVFTALSDLHSAQVKTRLVNLLTLTICRQTGFFYPLKSMHQNTGDEPSSILG